MTTNEDILKTYSKGYAEGALDTYKSFELYLEHILKNSLKHIQEMKKREHDVLEEKK